MADPADIASGVEELNREIAIQRVRATKGRLEDSAENCSDCGQVIPLARQVASPGCQMCVECAGRNEKRRARYR